MIVDGGSCGYIRPRGAQMLFIHVYSLSCIHITMNVANVAGILVGITWYYYVLLVLLVVFYYLSLVFIKGSMDFYGYCSHC